MKKQIKLGRPKKKGGATEMIQMRVTQPRKRAYERAAADRPVTKWATGHLDNAAGYKEA